MSKLNSVIELRPAEGVRVEVGQRWQTVGPTGSTIGSAGAVVRIIDPDDLPHARREAPNGESASFFAILKSEETGRENSFMRLDENKMLLSPASWRRLEDKKQDAEPKATKHEPQSVQEIRAANTKLVTMAARFPPREVLDGYGRKHGPAWDKYCHILACMLEYANARPDPRRITLKAGIISNGSVSLCTLAKE